LKESDGTDRVREAPRGESVGDGIGRVGNGAGHPGERDFQRRPPLLVIVGPTAVGKSAVGMELARKLGGEIVSADSMQVYRGMDIGTAKPSQAERAEIPHHLIDVADPDEIFCVARYQEMAREAIRDIAARGRLPIMVGGTGLYVDAVVRGFLFPDEGRNSDIRRRLEGEAEVTGSPALHVRLAEVDPVAAERIHPNDLRRIVRALEVYEVTGMAISELQRKHEGESEFDTVIYGLRMARQALNKRIDDRVDIMVEQGLIDEVRSLMEHGYDPRYTAVQAIGYKEFALYLAGEESLEEAIDTLKRETRKYAKRQMTWFRRNPNIRWIDVECGRGPEDIADEIAASIESWLKGVGFSVGSK